MKNLLFKEYKTTLVGLLIFAVASIFLACNLISGEIWFLSLGVAGLGAVSSDAKKE